MVLDAHRLWFEPIFTFFSQDIFKGTEGRAEGGSGAESEDDEDEDYDIEEVLKAHKKKGGKVIGM